MSIPDHTAEQAAFYDQPVDSQPWLLFSDTGGQNRLRFPQTGTVWAAWESYPPSTGLSVFIRHRSTGQTTMVIAPPSNYSVTAGDELEWQAGDANRPFRLGWGYVQTES